MDKQIKQGLTQSAETDQSDICIVNTNNSDQTENSRRKCNPYYYNDSWYELKQLRIKNVKNLIIGCLNINSLRRKYMHISDVFKNDLLDFFTIFENKLDASFPDANVKPNGYSVYRYDSTSTNGGVLTWIRSDIPHRCRKDLKENNDGVHVLCIEMHIINQKWIIISIYRLPNNTNLDTFHSSISKMSD